MTVLMLRARVTQADVLMLARSEPAKARAQAAHKICLKIADGGLPPEDRRAADEVVRIIAADRAQMVRKALAVALAETPHLPRDVAVRLARDIDEIAAPVLEGSPVFTEQDLIAVVRTGSTRKQCAIARRKTVAAPVVEAIIDHGGEEAVAALARNDGARLDAQGMASALRRFGARAALTEALIDRASLPPSVAERLVPLVTDETLQRLARRHPLPPQLAVELAGRGAIDVLDQAGCAIDAGALVEELHLDGSLTPTLMLRGLCLGHMSFFEHAMAELADVPHSKAWVLIHDSGPSALRTLFERTGAPARFLTPIRAAVELRREIERDGAPRDPERISRIMIERLLSRAVGLAREDMDYLLGKLDALMAERDRRSIVGEPQRRRRAL
jgi:uncharacterized protein (DUF2336 family)